ncbi:MAG TPA: peptidoglycan DD-metalloendopeptidase family protein [Spirochaetota bacterium]|nr:peptidoglycan DD-metalloendopeptidase family protein [Spirochaetota bacterium]HOL56091.1 peptidoglycan DD-metalloendopeptidase family protein [Spirochaetota bacterium]HPP03495.1 peptidoglycan DD-metalloendopeptidase family protein [Spirochaetota bacterium]
MKKIALFSLLFIVISNIYSEVNISKFANEEMNRALLEFRNGNYKESIKSCLKILNCDPNNHSSMLLLGYSYQSLGEYKKAEKTYTQILSLYPDHYEAKNALNSLYQKLINDAIAKKNINLAFSIIKRAEYYLPNEPIFYNIDADLNTEIENYDEAISLLKKYWELNPLSLEKRVTQDLWILNKITNIYKRLGKKRMAEWRDFITGLNKKFPENLDLMIMLANIYFFNDEEPVKRNNLRNKALKIYLSSAGNRESPPMFFPLKGRWIVISGPFQTNLDTHNGYDAYYLDFSKIDENKNRIFKGNGNENSDYLSYNEQVYASYDGIVEAVSDAASDNPVGKPNFLATNYVQIKHIIDGKVYYTVYYHLKKGSIRVSVGDKVSKGEHIGNIGNSGISYAPHLHFGLYDENKVSLPVSFYIDDNLSDVITPSLNTILEF